MDNVFFDFLDTYWDDVVAFINSVVELVKALANKITGSESEEEA